MDWRDLTPHARLSLAQEILSSLSADIASAGNAPIGRFFRSSRTRGSYEPEFLAEIARDELYWRTKRNEFVAFDIYGEAAWSMILDLYINRVRGKNISVTSACIASEVPPTTALRWMAMLESVGLIVIRDAEYDLRVRWVRLTDTGYEAVERYLVAKADQLRVGKQSKQSNDNPVSVAESARAQ